jgi:urea carboxylase
MDEKSFRLANRVVGNPETVTALEMTARGATLRFNMGAVFALVGARMKATLDGVEISNNAPAAAQAGQVLALGAVEGPGLRTYLAVSGGFEAPEFLGSRATFTLGGFGGHATGALKAGDVLHLGEAAAQSPRALNAEEIPRLTHDWRLGVVYGPHGAPDFFLEEDIETFFASEYEVHFNSARTGIRLTGPKPKWARSDGGEAGLHPSNIHDNAYAIGSIDFTGDMPIILGPDGPSLGGFVCPAVTARDELWKLGQLKPGDRLRFIAVARPSDPVAGPIVRAAPEGAGSPIVGRHVTGPIPVVYRRSGEDNLLVEYGAMTLDIGLRMRVHLLAQAVAQSGLPGLIDMTPGIRSLQIHYDGTQLARQKLLDVLRGIETALPSIDEMVVPSRIVRLPLSWNDPQAELAMRKYHDLVRPNAPWCPSNIEFIRRINGLPDEEAVRRVIFDASYLVLGLGDVYLGAPVATPVDPRHRLVTTKYNPARTWTPENAVGIGGAYMCVYGMEGPGGYQLFGRTIQMWNSWRSTEVFKPGTPWLLRFFDQIQFFPVSAEELLEARAAFPHGGYPISIEETQFSYAGYQAFLAREAKGIAAFKTSQQAAFEAERQRWRDDEIDEAPLDDAAAALASGGEVPDGCIGQFTEAPGNVWKVVAEEGGHVEIGQPLVIVESMKMEIAIAATARGIVRFLAVKPGQTLRAGDLVCALEEV